MALTTSHLVDISWTTEGSTLDVEDFRIYVAEQGPWRQIDDKGRVFATVPRSRRSASGLLKKGDYKVRVVARSKNGIETNWKNVPVLNLSVTGLARGITLLTKTVVAAVGTSAKIQVEAEAPPPDDDLDVLEVIQGPDEFRGHLVGHIPASEHRDSALLGYDPRVQPKPGGIYLAGDLGLTPQIVVRPVGSGKQAPLSGAIVQTPYMPPRPGLGKVLLASIDGATRVNFPAPTTADGFETVAVDGVRALQVPALNACTGWGSLDSGLGCRVPLGAKYVDRLIVVSDDVDLESVRAGMLDFVADFQRKSSVVADIGLGNCIYPLDPGADVETRDDPYGIKWTMSSLRLDGRPNRPLPPVRWFYRIADTDTGGVPDYGSLREYIPGQWESFRYIEVTAILVDPIPRFQIICPKLFAYLRTGDSGWTALTGGYSNSWTDGAVTPEYREVGGVLHFRGSIDPLGATASIFFTLPLGYRPPSIMYHPLTVAASSAPASTDLKLEIATNGDMKAINFNTADADYDLAAVRFFL